MESIVQGLIGRHQPPLITNIQVLFVHEYVKFIYRDHGYISKHSAITVFIEVLFFMIVIQLVCD